MKFYQLALFMVLASVADSLVSAKDAGPQLAFKPTEAPLMMSTAKPTVPPKINKPSPTKAMNYNVPPRVKDLLASKEHDKMSDIVPLLDAVIAQKDPMIAMESNDAPPGMLKSQEIPSHKIQIGDVKPVQVTGFITRNGNIYEIEGKDGIGLIEGRQSSADEKQENVCNYGSVVIYSDVPCDQVTNVKIGEIEQHLNAQEESAPVQQSDSSNNNQQKPQNDDDLEDLNDNSARRRKQQNRIRRPNRIRRRNGTRQRPSQNGNRIRQSQSAKQQQKRRQQQKKRQQLQRQQKKRRQQQKPNRNREWNRPNQWQNQQQQQSNRRRVPQRQQEDEYSSLDDDQNGYEYEYED